MNYALFFFKFISKLRKFRVISKNKMKLSNLGTGQKLEGGRAGANIGRAMVFHASTKERVKQFGACH